MDNIINKTKFNRDPIHIPKKITANSNKFCLKQYNPSP